MHQRMTDYFATHDCDSEENVNHYQRSFHEANTFLATIRRRRERSIRKRSMIKTGSLEIDVMQASLSRGQLKEPAFFALLPSWSPSPLLPLPPLDYR